MSLSVRSKLSPFLTTVKSLVFPKRPISFMNFNCRFKDDKSLIIDGPKDLLKSSENSVNIVDVKRLMKAKLFSESFQDYTPVGVGFSKKSRRLEEDSKIPMTRESILSYFDNNDRENHFQFHTMATQFTKCADCVTKLCKDAGRLKYHSEMEDAINKQIMSELNAAFGYLSIACFFGRSDVGKKGTHNFFMIMCNEEIQHAFKLIDYQLSRGGTVKLCNIGINESVEWCSIAKALEIALEIEKVITHEISNVICVAKKHEDLHTENMLISDFVTEQYDSVNKLARLLARAIRIGGCGVADHLIDTEMMLDTGHSTSGKPN